MKLVSSWSGGKDSCLACHKALAAGHQISHLVNFVSKEYGRCCFHGIDAKLMRLQAEATGIPLVQHAVSADMKNYEREFKLAVSALRDEHGIAGIVFGDIYLAEHKSWVERVCADLDIVPYEPLWGLDTENIMCEFIALGFKATIVSAKADIFSEDFIGRPIDEKMVTELRQRNICLCGENGEFHSFVHDGPIFKEKIVLMESVKILKKGFWEHWFLDITKYEKI